MKNPGNIMLLGLFGMMVLMSLFIIVIVGVDDNIKPVAPKSFEIDNNIKIDGTYIKPNKEWIYYNDTLSNYCFEQIDDSTLRLKCVCNCEDYENKINE